MPYQKSRNSELGNVVFVFQCFKATKISLMGRTPFLVDSQPTRVPNVPKRIGLKERRRMCLREGGCV